MLRGQRRHYAAKQRRQKQQEKQTDHSNVSVTSPLNKAQPVTPLLPRPDTKLSNSHTRPNVWLTRFLARWQRNNAAANNNQHRPVSQTPEVTSSGEVNSLMRKNAYEPNRTGWQQQAQAALLPRVCFTRGLPVPQTVARLPFMKSGHDVVSQNHCRLNFSTRFYGSDDASQVHQISNFALYWKARRALGKILRNSATFSSRLFFLEISDTSKKFMVFKIFLFHYGDF